MSVVFEFLKYPIAVVFGISLGVYLFKKIKAKMLLSKLDELKDCPFKFTVAWDESNEYIVFDLGNKVELWCEYGFGIRCDGVYGVSDLKLKGLNGTCGGTLTLPLGQSVFPLIEKMETFETWADKKTLEYNWEGNFEGAWEDMKKKLDNLRFLETKSLEKENKKKK